MQVERPKTKLGQLLDDPGNATPRERLQAMVSALLGHADVRTLITMGLDPWHWREHEQEMHARMQLRALRLLLNLLLGQDGGQQELVQLARTELSALLQVLDEEAQQRRRPVGSNALAPSVVRGLVRSCHAGRVVLCRDEGVVDPLAGVEPVVLVGLLAQDLFSVHGRSLDEE